MVVINLIETMASLYQCVFKVYFERISISTTFTVNHYVLVVYKSLGNVSEIPSTLWELNQILEMITYILQPQCYE